MPTKRLPTIRHIYAILGSLKKNDAGYMMGVIEHLYVKIHFSIASLQYDVRLIITSFIFKRAVCDKIKVFEK